MKFVGEIGSSWFPVEKGSKLISVEVSFDLSHGLAVFLIDIVVVGSGGMRYDGRWSKQVDIPEGAGGFSEGGIVDSVIGELFEVVGKEVTGHLFVGHGLCVEMGTLRWLDYF